MTESESVSSDEELNRTIERQEACLSRQLEWIRSVDSKTPTIIGLCLAMLAVIAAIAPPTCEANTLDWLFTVASSAPLVASLVYCCLATRPITKGPSGSLIYFGGIADLQSEVYSRLVMQRRCSEYLNDLNLQCHRNAQIASIKFAAVRKATTWMLVSAPIWLATIYHLHGR